MSQWKVPNKLINLVKYSKLISGVMEFHEKEKYVILPHLDKQKMSVTVEDGSSKIISRWKLIQEELLHLKEVIKEKDQDPIKFAREIESCVKTYNPEMNYKFGILEDSFKHKGEKVDDVIIFIIDATLSIEDLFEEGEGIDLLNGDGLNEKLELTRDQICAILGNAFFSTFPNREMDKTRFLDYPRINFSELFDDQSNEEGWKKSFREAKVEKVKCLLNYFSRMKARFGDKDESRVIFERRTLSNDKIPQWEHIQGEFFPLKVHPSGTIEDAVGSLQVDFANKFVGGGSLGSGAAQEEIRFICCPELIAAQLFTKVLEAEDTLLIHNFEQFSSYSGYSRSFKFSGNYEDAHVTSNHIVCLDAHQYPKHSLSLQLQKRWVERELNKCFIAFQSSDFCPDQDCSKIASGKWGCGVYNGDPILKSLIQWMASSHCKKSLDLYTFGDNDLSSKLCKLRDDIIWKKLSIGKLYKIILKYTENHPRGEVGFLAYIQNTISSPSKDIPELPITNQTTIQSVPFPNKYFPLQAESNKIVVHAESKGIFASAVQCFSDQVQKRVHFLHLISFGFFRKNDSKNKNTSDNKVKYLD